MHAANTKEHHQPNLMAADQQLTALIQLDVTIQHIIIVSCECVHRDSRARNESATLIALDYDEMTIKVYSSKIG